MEKGLLGWFDEMARELPWRLNRDPYRVWVSEVMLQQTQVQTVVGYFEKFMVRFPSVDDLAVARSEEVLALWSGLGYYRRARQMHEAAQRIVAGGRGFPSNSRELQKLPGIGPYTAAAVASIAFGERVPVLDGNVERVLSRRLALSEDPKQSRVRKRLMEVAVEILDPDRPGDSNQALMELGATVCRPRKPQCGRCPLARDCLGRLEGEPERYPPARVRRRIEKRELVLAVAQEDGRVLLFQRARDSRVLAGMWELPNVERQPALADAESSLAIRYGGRWHLGDEIGRLRHSITYRAFTLHVYAARFDSSGNITEGAKAAWVSIADKVDFPMSSMVEKVLAVSGF